MLARDRRLVVLAVAAVCAAQIGIVLSKVAAAEGTLRRGEAVLLRVRPVDPRSLARGQYARLDYDVSSIPLALVDTEFRNLVKGRRVYVSLRREGELSVASALTLEPPARGLYIAGRVTNAGRGQVFVDYGIEAFFASPDRALAIEERARDRDRPVHARVRVNRSGDAVLEDLLMSPPLGRR